MTFLAANVCINWFPITKCYTVPNKYYLVTVMKDILLIYCILIKLWIQNTWTCFQGLINILTGWKIRSRRSSFQTVKNGHKSHWNSWWMQGEVHFLKNISKLKIGFNEYGPNKMNTFSISNYTTVCELLRGIFMKDRLNWYSKYITR